MPPGYCWLLSASLRPSALVQRDGGSWSVPADQQDFLSAWRRKQQAGRREGGLRQNSTLETHPSRRSKGHGRTGGHGVAAPCPWAQRTPLPSLLQTSWARWRTVTAGSEGWTPRRGPWERRWAPTGSHRSPSSSSSISSLICITTITCPPPHPPAPPQRLWGRARPITCPTGYPSSPGRSAVSATGASAMWGTCRHTRRRWGVEGRRLRGTATQSPDTRQVRGTSPKVQLRTNILTWTSILQQNTSNRIYCCWLVSSK